MSNDLVAQLKALKLHGMAQTLPELMAKARSHALDAEQVLQALLSAESAEREVKSLAYQMKAARFPAHRDLAGFDFSQAKVDEALVRGAPRIHGELKMLGIGVSESTVAKYMIRHRIPSSQAWRTFLGNHVSELVSVDFFTVPTATFRVLCVFVILRHERREIVHFNATYHPTAERTAQQIVEAFSFDTAPRYLIRDRDSIYGTRFRNRVRSLGIEEVLSAPRSPWQNPYVERIIGSIRRECLNHVIIFNERNLRQVLKSYARYYHEARTHLSLDKQSPVPRSIETPDQGRVVAIPHVGGLHHEYRHAA
jgi:transposase InsO family protein